MIFDAEYQIYDLLAPLADHYLGRLAADFTFVPAQK
jgi:hypothetical protein